MSDPAFATASYAAAVLQRRPRLRFSLAGLLLAITLLSVALAVVSAPLWDADERLILASWFVGVLGLGSIERSRQKRGIVSVTLAGGLVPAGVALVLLGMGNYSQAGLAVAVWVGVLGAIGSSLAAGMFALLAHQPMATAGRWVRRIRSLGWRWRLGAATIVGMALAAFGTNWMATWRPIATLSVVGDRRGPSVGRAGVGSQAQFAASEGVALRDGPAIALSSDGERLAVAVPGWLAAESPLQVWRIAWPRSWRELSVEQPSGISFLDFAPDDATILITPRVRGSLRTVDRATGQVLQATAPESLSSTLLLGGRFRDDGRTLLVRNWSPSQHSLLQLDPRTLNLVRREDFAGNGAAILSDRGNRLAWLKLPLDQTGIGSIEVLDRRTSALQVRLDPVISPLAIDFSLDERRLAASQSVWDLSTGAELSLPGEAWGFADDGRMVIVVRHDRGFLLPSWLPTWVATLPLLRHVTSSGPRSQLLLVEATTGQQCYASAWQPRIEFVATSRNGRRLATSTASGRICVWDLPR